MSDHVAETSQKELGPVNTTLILTTTICTGGLTALSELFGNSVDHYALYILIVIWLLAILLCVALIGRVDEEKDTVTTRNWVSRWTLCIQRGAERVKDKWAYSLLLFAMATLGGTTSYLNFKRANAQTQMMQGRPAAEEDIWMALTQANIKAIEYEKASGRDSFKYTNLYLGNALEGLIIKGGQDAIKTLDLAPPLPAEIKDAFESKPIYKYDKVFPKTWGDEIFSSLGIQVVEKLPGSLNANTVYIKRDDVFIYNFYTTPVMLAVWSQDIAMFKKLISLGEDPAIATTFEIFSVNIKPKEDERPGYEYTQTSYTTAKLKVTLSPLSEAKRIGGAIAAEFSPSKSSHMQSAFMILR